MKRFLSLSGVCMATIIACLLVPYSIHAQQAGNVKVASAVICKGIADRQAVEPGSSFPVSVGKLTNIQTATEVVHTWYYGDVQRAQVRLNVNPPSWRTYSSKIIQSHEIGAWRVEILDATGNLLETVKFEITP
jgi:hypothetical protein